MADATDPMAAVRLYVDCFNSGDIAAMAATCDVPMSILDGMPPHVCMALPPVRTGIGTY
jgi:hypothetical protein